MKANAIAITLSMMLWGTYLHAQLEVVDADNGITASGSGATRKVSLGGSLTNTTTINFASFNLLYSGTGNIGIRTATPLAPLHVTKSVSGNFDPTMVVEDTYTQGYTMLQLRGTNRRYHLGVGNQSETANNLADKFFIWDNDAAAARMTITSTGNIGIGTVAPATKLHVHGTYTITHPTFTGTFTAEHINNGQFRFNLSNVGEFLRIGPGNIIDFAGQQVRAHTRGATFSNTQSGYALETVTGNVVVGAGNVLIGTTTDNGNRFQVNGSTYTTGLIIPTGAGAGKVLTSDASGVATWQTTAGGSANAWVYGGNNVAGASQIGNTSNQNLQIITNNTSRIHIASTGEVGIGTTAVSTNYKLSVEGSVRARKVRVDQLTWPDYVFDPSYTLRPLRELEQFIKNYSRLPDVPSAAQVQKEGIDLGDNQAELLKKIEELTLYIIEQNKRLEEQNKRITELEKRANQKD